MVAQQRYWVANIERLRILAAFGIVWFHTDGAVGRAIGYSGLPIFLMVFCALSSWKPEPEDFLPFARKKAKRLLKPWLFWSLIYAGCKLLRQGRNNMDFIEPFEFYMIFTGPRLHLWYLPFSFVGGLIINLIQRSTVRVSSIIAIVLTTLAGLLLLSFGSVTFSLFEMPIPLPQWIFGLPAIPLGFAIGRVFSSVDKRNQKLLYFIIAVTTGCTCLVLKYLGYSYLIIQYGIATILVCAVFIWNGKWDPLLQKCASLTYGIYLIHPLLVSVFDSIGMHIGNPVLLVVIVFLLSSVITFILQRTPLRQFV